MAKLAPPPPTTQDVSSRQFRDWFYSIFQFINQQSGTFGTMAYEDSNDVAITGGAIGGVGITGSDINSTPIGDHTPSTGAFTNLSSSGTVSGTGFTNLFASPPPIGSTTPNSGYFTSTLERNGYTVKPNCYVEAYDLSSSIALTSTPTILSPASTASASGITYSAGVFTFSQEGDYSLSLAVNAIASAANQIVYIYAENNTGSGWTLNANSGKIYYLPNGQQTQIVYAQSVHRTAGQQVRYRIYSNDSKVTLQTATLPSTSTVYVPAIRIQYS
jgi:hypothetical protein